MNIAVLVKEVPDLEARVQVTGDGSGLEVEPKRVLNFFDEIAVEAALQLKQAAGGRVVAVGTGLEALRRALAMGADAAVRLEDPALEGADPLTVARALAAAVAKEGFDLVLAGKQGTDTEAGLVGPMVAEVLGVPCVTGVVGCQAEDGSLVVTREADGRETLRVPLPALLTAEKGWYEPRVPQVMGLMKAMRAQIPAVSLADLGVEAVEPLPSQGFQGPRSRPEVRMIQGEPEEAAAELVRLLRDEARVI
ncbi:electron transfer flavoprotein subunit beta/FixA family protein [Deferrisoma camini]|uniref:electron transfer flavoprotein subunit beta/FixA family protein n=1 Tax=Deferrisoma camini TaxID=1035120 RepID=UPI00046D023A|nr:electron transfer flavoprotein subunit beta/FixA family protein [Deferrisoma camini]